MKYPFTNATIASKRKGEEHVAPTHSNHPARETVIVSDKSALPVLIKKHEPKVKPADETEAMKAHVLKVLAEREKEKARKAANVPKSRILSMNQSSAPSSDLLKEYQDVLAMLLAKK